MVMAEKRQTIKGLEAKLDAHMKINSALLDRINLANRAGLQYGGDRNLYTVFGYKTQITHQDFESKYLRQDIAARIVEAPAAAVWGRPPRVFSPSNPDWETQWKALVKKRKIWNYLERLDKLSGLGRFAILLMGISDTGTLTRPVNGNADNELLYLQPFGERLVSIDRFEEDPLSERFNLPLMYKVEREANTTTSSAGGTSQRLSSIEAHQSRVLHVVENPLEDTVFGTPRIARVYNLLDDLLKVVGGSSEAFWLNSRGGLQADIDKEMELDADDAAALSTAIDEYMHQMRRVLRTRGVKINTIDTRVSDPEGTFRTILALISGATGIPQRILLGSEAGQLASEQDRANWAERVEDRRMNFAQPLVLDPFVDMLMTAGVLPEVDDIEYEWPEAFRLSPVERSTTMAQVARAIVNISKQVDSGFPIVDQEEARRIIGLMDTKDLSDLIPEPEGEEGSSGEADPTGENSDEDAADQNADEVTNTPVDTGGGEFNA